MCRIIWAAFWKKKKKFYRHCDLHDCSRRGSLTVGRKDEPVEDHCERIETPTLQCILRHIYIFTLFTYILSAFHQISLSFSERLTNLPPPSRVNETAAPLTEKTEDFSGTLTTVWRSNWDLNGFYCLYGWNL